MANEDKKEKKENIFCPAVLFYVGNPYIFRSTFIGHLYEISQTYRVILLSEKLDHETEKILADKKLFPKLEKIIPVNQYPEKKKTLFNLLALFVEHKRLRDLARNVVQRYKPNIVIAPSDYYTIFELYLFRHAKRIGVLKIAMQTSNVCVSKTKRIWVDLTNAYLRFPRFLPLFIRLFLVNCRKYIGYIFYCWIFPLFVGEKPLLGKSSFILGNGISGMRDADYQIVFSERDYGIFINEGVPREKLYILAHPLARGARSFFEKAYLNNEKKNKKNGKITTLFIPTEIKLRFRKKDYSLISTKKGEETWMETVKLISEILSGWKIYIKPHPDTKNLNGIKEKLESISKNIEFTHHKEPADKYIKLADVIMNLPPSISTVLSSTSLQYPEKPILSLDFHQEILGDYYKNFEGVEYINNKEKFVSVLKKIRDNKYRKEYRKSKRKLAGFLNTVELLKYLLQET